MSSGHIPEFSQAIKSKKNWITPMITTTQKKIDRDAIIANLKSPSTNVKCRPVCVANPPSALQTGVCLDRG